MQQQTQMQIPKLSQNITLRGSTEIVTEFFGYAVNSILYQRGLYPPSTFEVKKKYGLGMLVSSDEEIKNYLVSVLDQINEWLIEKKLEKLEQQKQETQDGALYKNAVEWRFEFPNLLDDSGEFVGFDVVIGNPPYVRVQSLKENYFLQTEFLEKTYLSASGKYDLYAIFMEISYNLINEQGLISFILPHKFLVADFGNGIRKFLSENKAVESIVHFGSEIVFNDASTYTCIINLQKKTNEVKFVKIKPSNITNAFKFNSIDYSHLSNEAWLLKDKREISLFDKITKGESLKKMCEGIKVEHDVKATAEGRTPATSKAGHF